MRKSLSLAFIMLSFFVCVCLSYGQESGFSMKARIGVNMSELKGSGDDIKSESGLGGQMFLNMDYEFKNKIYIESGLGLSYKTGRIKINSAYWKNDDAVKAVFLQLPLQIGYKVKINDTGTSFRPAAGFYFAYDVTKNNYGDNFDKGLIVSAGLSFNKAVVDFGYEHGFDNKSYSRRTFFLTLGYTLH